GSAGAIGVTFDLNSQAGIRLQNSSNSRQAFTRARLQGELTGVEKNVGHIDDQTARRLPRLHNLIELLQELLPGLLFLLFGALGGELCLLGLGLRNLLLSESSLASRFGFLSFLRLQLSLLLSFLSATLRLVGSLLLGQALGFPLLLFSTTNRQQAGIFGALHDAAGHGANRLTALVTPPVVPSPAEKVFGLAQSIGGIALGAGGLGDRDRIHRLEQIVRRFRIGH